MESCRSVLCPLLSMAVLLLSASCTLWAATTEETQPQPDIPALAFTFSDVSGIGAEEGVCRRDPSDVIKVDGTWYVWYTKVTADAPLYPSGYNGTVWYATSKDEGHTWVEREMAIGVSKQGFDDFGVFTPNIMQAGGRFYLYYTAVAHPFENKGYSETEKTAIGVAVAANPRGPWLKKNEPVLRPSSDAADFDSFRVDDACMIIRDGRYWMYYKGRQWERTPGETRMGVAVADDPVGPFVKQREGQPVQDSGHEVLVWPWRGGVMSLVSPTGPNGRTVQFAENGLDFQVVQRDVEPLPRAPGLYRRDLSGAPDFADMPSWGIAMAAANPPYLVRFAVTVESVE